MTWSIWCFTPRCSSAQICARCVHRLHLVRAGRIVPRYTVGVRMLWKEDDCKEEMCQVEGQKGRQVKDRCWLGWTRTNIHLLTIRTYCMRPDIQPSFMHDLYIYFKLTCQHQMMADFHQAQHAHDERVCLLHCSSACCVFAGRDSQHAEWLVQPGWYGDKRSQTQSLQAPSQACLRLPGGVRSSGRWPPPRCWHRAFAELRTVVSL